MPKDKSLSFYHPPFHPALLSFILPVASCPNTLLVRPSVSRLASDVTRFSLLITHYAFLYPFFNIPP